MTDEFDDIAHPARYCEGREIEPMAVMMGYDPYVTLMFTLKYISRCDRKDERIKEMKKAIQYIDFLIACKPYPKMYDKYEVIEDWKLPSDLSMATFILMDIAKNHYHMNSQSEENFCGLCDETKKKLELIKHYLNEYIKKEE